MDENEPNRTKPTEPNESKLNRTEPNQTKLNRTEPNQTKTERFAARTILRAMFLIVP